jgi:hypothetical protein
MIVMSESIEELAPALAAAQAEMGSAHLDAKNPHFRSKYASLASCLNAAAPALAKHHLSIQQHPGFDAAAQLVSVTTMLLHKSGQYIQSTCHLPLGGKRDGHALKSATTYLRRTAIVSVLALPEEDDDGNATSAVSVARRAPDPTPAPTKVTAADIQLYREMLGGVPLDYRLVADFFKVHGKPAASDANSAQLSARLDWCKRHAATIIKWGDER